MLLRFSASNFGSLRDRQELSLVASKLKGESKGLIEAPELRNESILPAAVIYGANASGKSNFVKALAHMRDFVRNSHRQGEPGAPLSLKPFALDPEYSHKPSSFAADFICDGAVYSYGFEATLAGFIAESLHASRGGRSSLLFERGPEGYIFGRNLKGRNRLIEEITRPNSLFLSAAAQNNHDELSRVANFFERLHVFSAGNVSLSFASSPLASRGVRPRTIDLMREIDVGVTDFKIEEAGRDAVAPQLGTSPPDSRFNTATTIVGNLADRQMNLELRLGHPAKDGRNVYFDLADESDGTVQLLGVLDSVFWGLEHGQVVIIDEFGSRLHTRASEIILSLFNNKETNPKGAQLIVATHDTNLLNAEGLRRDQVWFTEKDQAGATHLYPLTDYFIRKGDNLEKGYLQGRFGAIPFAGSAANLLRAV